MYLNEERNILFLMRDVNSARNCSRRDLDSLIKDGLKMKRDGIPRIGGTVTMTFFEKSTRTHGSFEAAAQQLGMHVTGFPDPESSSVGKGETIADTVRMYERYRADVLVIRHPLAGAAQAAADSLDIPVINAGDSDNGHPTQTELDLMTIQEKFGTIDGKKIAMVGDLLYGRTVHSLFQALEVYDSDVWLVSPDVVKMPQWRIDDYKRATGREVVITEDLMDAIRNVDVLYMTRVQRERFPDTAEGNSDFIKSDRAMQTTAKKLREAKPELIVMHPLPRVNEITRDVDETEHALYFTEVENGLFLRAALINRILNGEEFEGRNLDLGEEPELRQDLEITNGAKSGRHLIYRLNNGTLIDHIEEGKGMIVYHLLGLKELKKSGVSVVPPMTINSKRYGKKDVIAIHGHQLSPQQSCLLKLASDRATVNYINGGIVKDKFNVVLPNVLEGVLQCPRDKDVTNPKYSQHLTSRFYVESRNPLRVRDHFCGTPYGVEEVRKALTAPLLEKIKANLEKGFL